MYATTERVSRATVGFGLGHSGLGRVSKGYNR